MWRRQKKPTHKTWVSGTTVGDRIIDEDTYTDPSLHFRRKLIVGRTRPTDPPTLLSPDVRTT